MKFRSITHFAATSLALAAAFFITANAGLAGDKPGQDKEQPERARILPPGSTPYGHTYAEWSALWWQWVTSLPADNNPALDTGDCGEGQSGDVWFLAGSFFGPEPIVRECTVPAGKAFFFPIVNTAFFITEEEENEEVARQAVNDAIDQVTSVSLKIDGKPIKHINRHYRTDSALFEIGPLPANNIFGVNEGTTLEGVSDGYFVMLKPLHKGKLTIHFKAETNSEVSQDVTYILHVGGQH
jgi:hypothetical protein